MDGSENAQRRVRLYLSRDSDRDEIALSESEVYKDEKPPSNISKRNSFGVSEHKSKGVPACSGMPFSYPAFGQKKPREDPRGFARR